MRRRRTLAIVANEFFSSELGRMGGFGWAVRAASNAIREHLDDRLDVVLVSCEHRSKQGWPATAHGRRFLTAAREPPDWRRALRHQPIDALLTIDFRSSYAPLLRTLARTPMVVWVRDPRPPELLRRIGTLRIPGADEAPQGIADVDCTGLAELARIRRGLRRRQVVFASPAPSFLRQRAAGTYGFATGPLELLPNPVTAATSAGAAGTRRRVVYLGRLDPIKRPWLAVEIARRKPDIELLLLGRSYFEGPGSWRPDDLPRNVMALGHLDGEERDRALQGSSLLLNTSIHEALPVSFLEALALELPLVACVDPEQVVSRFGGHVDPADGDGMGALPALEAAVTGLLADDARRSRLGREGHAWVSATHTPRRFAERLMELLDRLGV